MRHFRVEDGLLPLPLAQARAEDMQEDAAGRKAQSSDTSATVCTP